jgi:ribosome-associated protein
MPTSDVRKQVSVALGAVESKKAEDISLLQLPTESSTFTDYFLICSGHNPAQVQAIADEVDERLSKGLGVEPNTREGYELAEWILLDYVDFVVHIFNAQRRAYYDLERLWKSAHRLTAAELQPAKKPAKKAVRKVAAKKAAGKAPSVRAATKKTAGRSGRAAGKKTAPSKKAASKSTKKSATRVGVAKKAAKKAVTKKPATKKTAAKRTAKKGRAQRK